jgi:uncharacterized membrane protein YeaQ/YmgE (transglycosylase-associated protein family)
VGVFSWIIVGLIAAAIATRVTGNRNYGCLTKIVVGVIGGLIGGALDNAAGGPGLGEFGLRSILLSAVGATLFLAALNAIGTGRLRQ